MLQKILNRKERSLSQKLKDLYEQQTPNVIRDISPNDKMYVQGRIGHYFSVGQSALRCIKLAMLATGKEDFNYILDFPCGHGRVLRTLAAAFPKAKITACDLDRDGVDFCAKVLGAIPIYSHEEPSKLPLKGNFDLIWCGSFLTHIDSDRWSDWLSFFNSLLSPGGILIFTVHGNWIAHRIRNQVATYGLDPEKLPLLLDDFDRNGFAYLDYPNQSNYGISVSSPAWVLSQLQKLPDLRLLTYTERGWDTQQDAIACVCDRDSPFA